MLDTIAAYIAACALFVMAIGAIVQANRVSGRLNDIDLRLAGLAAQGTKLMGSFDALTAQAKATEASASAAVLAVNQVLAALEKAQASLTSLEAAVEAVGGVDPAKYDALTAGLAAAQSALDGATATIAKALTPAAPAPVPAPVDPAPPAPATP